MINFIVMGQESSKVVFEGNRHDLQRRRIFSAESSAEGLGSGQDYNMGRVGSALQPKDKSLKARSSYLSQHQPFGRSSQRMGDQSIHDETSRSEKQWSEPEEIEQMPPATHIPTRITYYNAWSVPMQRYYIEGKEKYEPGPQPTQAEPYDGSYEPTVNPTELKYESMIKKMVQERAPPPVRQQGPSEYDRRRQNLNLY